MPLPDPVRRSHMHRRSIELNGYTREDGLFDIEGRITDFKAGPYETATDKVLAPGEPLHDMWVRLVVDESLKVHEVHATTDASPHWSCPGAVEFLQRLCGLSLARGWRAAVSERLAGVEGCAHIKELLNVMPSAAFQSLTPVRRQRMAEQGTAVRPVMIDSCLAYSSAGPLVQKKWPEYFKKRNAGD